MQMARSIRSDSFRQLARHALQLGLNEARSRAWLRKPAFGLGGKLPMELLEEPGGLELLEELVGRIAYGAHS